MSLVELLPTVRSLSRSDKLRLIQWLAVDLAQAEEPTLIPAGQSYPRPRRRPGRRKARRWVVERAPGWLSKCRALLVRDDEHDETYLGRIQLACGLLGFRRLHRLKAA